MCCGATIFQQQQQQQQQAHHSNAVCTKAGTEAYVAVNQLHIEIAICMCGSRGAGCLYCGLGMYRHASAEAH
jgi:hypothetical protein